MTHKIRMLGEPYIDAHVRFCAPVPTTGHNRHELGDITQAEVTEALTALKRQRN
jgi:hypothetical protein